MPDVDTMWFVRRMQFMNITGAAIASCLWKIVFPSPLLFLSFLLFFIYMYIHTHMCVCVCVCVTSSPGPALCSFTTEQQWATTFPNPHPYWVYLFI
jgi:hypothetical protein